MRGGIYERRNEIYYYIHNWVPETIEEGKKEAPGKIGALTAIGYEGQCEINKQIIKNPFFNKPKTEIT